jgi:hypothetical protein
VGDKFPHDFECAECAEILRALLNDFHVDHRDVRARFRETAKASGRNLAEMRIAWTNSVGRMPPDEQMTLMKNHYPRLAEARRRKQEHEIETGHAVRVHGWAKVFGRKPFEGRLPGK